MININFGEPTQDYTMEYCIHILREYIHQTKGVWIQSIIPPRNKEEIELFERMINMALTYFKL
jgi:hypothetical protein